MKIAYVSLYPAKGEKHSYVSGAAYFTKDLAINIPFNNNDQLFIICNKLNDKIESYKEDGFFIKRCFDRNPKFIYQIINEVRKIKPDIIHIQQELALYGNPLTAYLLQWLLFLLRLFGNKIIITIHGIVPITSIDKNFIKKNNNNLPVWLVKLAFLVIFRPLCVYATKVIVHGEYFKRALAKEYGVKSDKVEATNIGIENSKVLNKNIACNLLGLDSKKNIVLFMGYLAGYKGLDLLIEGFFEYAKLDKNAFLLIGAGKHPKLFNNKDYLNEYNRIVKKANEMIPKDQYKWVGFINEKDMQTYFGASDVSIYPYTICMGPSGPMGLSIGRNRPFLASDAFDIIVDDKRMLFKQNPNNLSKALTYFFNNKKYFQKSLDQIREDRSWIKIGKKTYKIYQSLSI